MGIVEKQATRNTIWSYAGLAIGYVNIIILFPAYFSVEQFGLVQLIQSIAVVYSQFSSFGLVNIIVRYFPFFRTPDKKHMGFISWVLIIMLCGFIVMTVLYLIFRPLIIDAYIQKSGMFVEYYYVLIPLSFFALLFNVMESFVRVIHRTVLAVFSKEVLLRLLTSAGILLVFFKVLSFPNFILYFVLSNFLIVLILLVQMASSGEFKFKRDFKSIELRKIPEILKYGMFTLVAGSSYFFAQNIDKIMLGAMVGLPIVGIYSVYLYIATVVTMPARSMYRITVPIVANYWKDDDREKIREMYKRTSLVLMLLGTIIYVGILVNLNNISYFLKPEYKGQFTLFIVLGLSFLVDMSGGMNSDIINTSPRFKYDTLFNVVYMVLCIVLSYFFIKAYGGVGAAIAMMVSMFAFNFMKWLFLQVGYKMQPFSFRNLLVVIAGAASFFAGWYFPVIGNVYADIVVRSILTAAVYFGILVLLKVSEDVQRKVEGLRRMFGASKKG